jgi:hypothetical protein
LDFGKFLVQLIGRIKGLKSGKKALFLQTKADFEEQKLGGQAGRENGRRKNFHQDPAEEHRGTGGHEEIYRNS